MPKARGVQSDNVQPNPTPRFGGAYKGEFTMPDGFFDELPEDELAAWEGKTEPAIIDAPRLFRHGRARRPST